MKKYDISFEVEAPDEYNLPRVAAAVALALTEEPAKDLKVTRIDVDDQSSYREVESVREWGS